MADYLTEGRINLSVFFVVKVIHNLVTFNCKRKQLNLDLFKNVIFYQHFIINKNLIGCELKYSNTVDATVTLKYVA